MSQLIEKIYSQAVSGIEDKWLSSIGSDWYDHIRSLPGNLQVTYMTVILHNQVINGGFHQYFLNGYGQFAEPTIECLENITNFSYSQPSKLISV